MASSLTPFDDGDDTPVLVDINTTPLVDVMLVLLIIFLITMPVISATIPVTLPRQQSPVMEQSRPATTITVDQDGRVYWNDTLLAGSADLASRLATSAPDGTPVHIRADENTPFAPVAAIIEACRAAGIAKVGFLTQQKERP